MFIESHTPPTEPVKPHDAGMLSHTPPGGGNNKMRPPADPGATAAAVGAARRLRGGANPTRQQMPVGETGPAADGLPKRSERERLKRAASWARVMSCVTEFGSHLRLAPDADRQFAAVNIGDAFLALLKRPSASGLAHNDLGLPATVARAGERADANSEIVAHDADLDTFFFDAARWPLATYPLTYEVVQFTQEVTNGIVQWLKLNLVVPRPSEVLRGFETAIEVPSHESYPGGHAAQAMATAVVLGRLMGSGDKPLQTWLRAIALRIAEVRVIAGLHYPIDTIAGLALGDLIGSAIVDFAEVQLAGSRGWALAVDPAADPIVGAKFAFEVPKALAPMPLLSALWQLASDEIAEARK